MLIFRRPYTGQFNKSQRNRESYLERPGRFFDRSVERWQSSRAAAGDDNSEILLLLLLLLLLGATDSFIVALPRQPAAAVSAVSIYVPSESVTASHHPSRTCSTHTHTDIKHYLSVDNALLGTLHILDTVSFFCKCAAIDLITEATTQPGHPSVGRRN